MKITSAISTAALSALMLVGLSSRAQEATHPETAPASSDASANPQSAATVSANSKVRIVRLSEVKGEVQMDRQTGKGFEAAMANLPVVEGSKLKTGDGVAEVEFEDNSTVRLALNSEVEFPKLELLPSGAKIVFDHRAAGHCLCEPDQNQGKRIQREVWPANGKSAA